MLTIIKAETTEKAYAVAAEAFASMWEKVTGEKLPIAAEDDGKSDLIVIGSDAVNDVTARFFAEDRIDTLSIRYGTDDYAVYSVELDGRNALVLAGGRGRSTLYAVYDYFERAAGCHYYWDGDVIPHHDTLPLDGFRVAESPRFEWRGLRYFAHRGLHRLQAEHWSLEEWKREIDWIVKRRMDYFMLRTGMDDLFQRAFPEEVSYPNAAQPMPDGEISYAVGPRGSGYDDRTPFWPLEYRGILREKLLEYARERDLIYSEDCGTMTHWYSRTPTDYLEAKNPPLLEQEDHHYCQHPNGVVWDPRVRENMENYFRLTETAVRDWSKTRVFHTIGLAERNIFEDRKKNLNLKLFTYRRILQGIRERYPDAKMLIASWDFVGWWKPEDVQALMKDLDPENTLILDYTNEGDDPEHTFLNWGMVGRFPWIFGIFHAYERQSSIRGPYDITAERLKIAAEDPMCKGLIFWPELSHSDTLVLEYLARNSWRPDQRQIEPLAESFSHDRYGVFGDAMNDVWQRYLPMVKRFSWGGYCSRKPDDPEFDKYGDWDRYGSFMMNMLNLKALRDPDEYQLRRWKYECGKQREVFASAAETLRALMKLPAEALENPFVTRDAVDIARSLTEQHIHHGIMALELMLAESRRGKQVSDAAKAQMEAIAACAELHAEMIGCHADYSMFETLEGLKKVCPVNPYFETAQKRDLVNGYCRQAAYEPEKKLFLAELKAYFAWARNALDTGDWTWNQDETENQLYQAFIDTPLADLRPACDIKALPALIEKAAGIIENIRL